MDYAASVSPNVPNYLKDSIFCAWRVRKCWSQTWQLPLKPCGGRIFFIDKLSNILSPLTPSAMLRGSDIVSGVRAPDVDFYIQTQCEPTGSPANAGMSRTQRDLGIACACPCFFFTRRVSSSHAVSRDAVQSLGDPRQCAAPPLHCPSCYDYHG